jgi:hypothetical protein
LPDEKPIALFQSRDDRGTRSLWVTRLGDGRLKIEGQDLGPAVAFFGEDFTEYEWDWTIGASDIPRVAELLGGSPGSDPVAVMGKWVRDRNGADPGQELKQLGLDIEFWSRIGE